MVQNLINTVEGVFLINDGIEKNAEGPDVLLLATVGLAGENFGGGVIYATKEVSCCSIE